MNRNKLIFKNKMSQKLNKVNTNNNKINSQLINNFYKINLNIHKNKKKIIFKKKTWQMRSQTMKRNQKRKNNNKICRNLIKK